MKKLMVRTRFILVEEVRLSKNIMMGAGESEAVVAIVVEEKDEDSLRK